MNPSTPEPQPPGWYDDPTGAANLRWWDGTQWTPSTRGQPIRRRVGTQTTSALAATAAKAWSGHPKLRWWVVGFGMLAALSIFGNIVGPPPETTMHASERAITHAAVAPRPIRVRQAAVARTDVAKTRTFWSQQSAAVKAQLVDYCLADIQDHKDDFNGESRWLPRVDRGRTVRQIDAHYAKYDFYADDKISDVCRDAAESQTEQLQEAHEKQLKRSVRVSHFIATPQRVRRYYAVEQSSDDLRSVSCAGRSSCTISVNGNVGDLGRLGDLVFGSYNRDHEAQLTLDTTELFHRLFHDKRFQRGTITTYLEVETPGGKSKTVPALTVTCDRAANAQINWDRVGPDGLRRYCAYQLANIRGLGS